jgi:hypothetical protein
MKETTQTMRVNNRLHTHTHVGNREIQINFFKVIIREEVFCGYLINQPIIKCTQSVAGIYQNDN